MNKKANREAGLTLIEVLIVVAILGVILAIVIPSYAASTKRAQEKLCDSTKTMVEAQMELYQLDTKGKDHPLTDDMTTAQMNTHFAALVAAGYLRETPTCPAGGEFRRDKGKLKCSIHDPEP